MIVARFKATGGPPTQPRLEAALDDCVLNLMRPGGLDGALGPSARFGYRRRVDDFEAVREVFEVALRLSLPTLATKEVEAAINWRGEMVIDRPSFGL